MLFFPFLYFCCIGRVLAFCGCYDYSNTFLSNALGHPRSTDMVDSFIKRNGFREGLREIADFYNSYRYKIPLLFSTTTTKASTKASTYSSTTGPTVTSSSYSTTSSLNITLDLGNETASDFLTNGTCQNFIISCGLGDIFEVLELFRDIKQNDIPELKNQDLFVFNQLMGLRQSVLVLSDDLEKLSQFLKVENVSDSSVVSAVNVK
ncbi:TPA_asm: hypothetical protein 1 [Manila clam xenomavirus]|nr:TPA_asm: hypothetical protein 1 [Manila clam xenomavirus]